MRKLIILLPLVLFCLLAVILFVKLMSAQDTEMGEALNRPLPPFSLPALYGNGSTLTDKDIKGEFALINVFASWCVVCVVEHPFLMSLKERNLLPIYGLNWRDEEEDAKAWLARHGNPYQKIGADQEGKVVIDLGITGAPESFLVNRNGVIIYHYAGMLSKEVFTQQILPRIKQ